MSQKAKLYNMKKSWRRMKSIAMQFFQKLRCSFEKNEGWYHNSETRLEITLICEPDTAKGRCCTILSILSWFQGFVGQCNAL